MTLITGVIGRLSHQHFVSFAAVRIVAGSAADLHISLLGANHMARTLENSFANTRMAAQTSVLYRETRQHVLLGLSMVLAMTRKAAHVLSVVLTALKSKGMFILGMALQTGLVGLRRWHFSRIAGVCTAFRSAALFGVFRAVGVANLTRGRPRVCKKFGTFPMDIRLE